MNLRELIILEAKDTLGYAEAVDKESFLTGVGVALSKTTEYYDKRIEILNIQIESYKQLYENTVMDLTSLASIIKKYSNDDN